ncbi:MAG: hypothetical protein O3A85_00460 [Proteobacteria bacterium]|nr:hypothetical protein [Pseudomonadota bacterium]
MLPSHRQRLGMLLHQGPPAWMLWFGVEPVVTEVLRDRMERSFSTPPKLV